MTAIDHGNPTYDEVTEWVRKAEIGLGASQNAYDGEGAMPIQNRSHPDANMDGFIPPSAGEVDDSEVDWGLVLSLKDTPSYQRDDAEMRSIAEDIDLGTLDDPDFEGSLPPLRRPSKEEKSLDPRFTFNGLVEKWPRTAEVYYAIIMSTDTNSSEPIGEDAAGLKTLRCANGWYVDDSVGDHLVFMLHDPCMNHPLSACVKQGDYVVWVYNQLHINSFPSAPVGYIHNGSLFRGAKKE